MITLLVIGSSGVFAKKLHSRKLQAPAQDNGQNPKQVDTKSNTKKVECTKELPYLWPSDGTCHQVPQMGDQDCKDTAKPYRCGDEKCYKSMSECRTITGNCWDASKPFSCFTGNCTEDWEACKLQGIENKISRDCENPLV